MNYQRFLTAVTIVNLALLGIGLARSHAVEAQGDPPVLRGRALEIVDDHGRVRVSIKVLPVDLKVKKPNGKPYAETVIIRLIDPNGRPTVKVAGSEDSSGLSFVGETDSTQVILQADGSESSLRLANKDGRAQTIRP